MPSLPTQGRAAQDPAIRRIAGRYVVEAELAVGGMGAVYRVRDESSGKVLALKRLLPDAHRAAAILFRKEYHTLVLLQHPRIIEVYDYGVDAGGPYYTMELLEGDDLRALAPLPYREACRYLRDVASSLALLHAHRLLHRDLTPRNVRATKDGRCKLIDFGALSPFGMPQQLVGTAPFVPPEALRGLALDQRADLFSLGALAYYLLTRAHAYPARSLSQLESMWGQHPAVPSGHVGERDETASSAGPIPAALDDLVMSLLSLDPLARPASAAEVIERLDSVAELTPDPGPWTAQSYLLSAQLVGRTAEIERAKELAARAVSGAGGVLSIRHAPGVGGTRLLAEIGLEARFVGATVLQVDAEVYRGPYGVARALAEKLLRAAPDPARPDATSDIGELGWAQGPATERLKMRVPPVDIAAGAGVWRVRVQSALEKWFLSEARSRAIVILVDNLHRVDEGSASVLALLGAVAKDHALLIAATLRAGEPVSAPAPVERLIAGGESLALHPMTAEDTSALVRSLFGDVPNSERLSQWLHRISAGHPLHLMELSRYLVTNHIARYIDGTWALPREMPTGLPSRIEEAMDSRLAQLSPKALGLASALSIQEGPLSLELCVGLAETEHGDPFSALDELTAEGVLVAQGNSYRFAQGTLRERFLSHLSRDELERLHRMIGDRLLESAAPDLTTTLEAGWHLFHGGERERGADILRRVGLELVDSDELPQAVPALEAAVSVYRKLGRPRHELLGLLSPLAFAGFYVDRRLADRYGDEALALLGEETGLALTVRVRPYVGGHLGLLAGLIYALGLHCFGGRGGVRGLSDHVAILGGLSAALTATATICLDTEGAARRAGVFEPLRILGRRHAGAFSYELSMRLVELTRDHPAETMAGLRALLVQLDSRLGVIGFPERMRPISKGGALYALGALESFMDAPLALERADELEACGLRLYDMVACQVRASYHACRGEVELTREYERKVELYAVRSGTAWQAEAWAPISRILAFTLTGDIIGLKHAAEELQRLAGDIPSLSRYARIAAAGLKVLRGEHESAIPLLEALVKGSEPRSHIGWCTMVSLLATAYNATGRHDRAEAACSDVLRQLSEADRWVVAMYLRVEIQLAMAEAGLGRTAEAARRLDELVAKHEPNKGPVTMGSLHRARAEVALLASDRLALEHHHAKMQSWFRPTGNPALIAQCERLARLIRPSLQPGAPDHDAKTVLSNVRSDPWLSLAACAGPEERARCALALALERYCASSGFLLGLREGELTVLAESSDSRLSDGAVESVGQRIALALDTDRDTTMEDSSELPDALRRFSVVVLACPAGGSLPRGVGALVLSPESVSTTPALRDFARELATALHDWGDVSTGRL